MASTVVGNGNDCSKIATTVPNGNDCSKWQRPFTKGKLAAPAFAMSQKEKDRDFLQSFSFLKFIFLKLIYIKNRRKILVVSRNLASCVWQTFYLIKQTLYLLRDTVHLLRQRM